MPDAPENHGTGRVGRIWAAAGAAAFAFAAALAAANTWFGPLNQDEGWYLLAAQNVRRGLLPYRDFLFTQGPVMPFAYAALAPLWSPFGVLGGRVTTALFGLAAAALCAWSASRLARRIAGATAERPAFFLTFSLLALSPDWAYFSAIPKTYALAALLLSAGLALCCTEALPKGGARGHAAAFAAGACFALCAGTRATLALAAVPVWCALVLATLRRRIAPSAPVFFAIGCAATLALTFAPPLLFARDSFVFSQTYHTARAAAPIGRWLVLRAAFFCFLAQGCPGLVAAAALLMATRRRRLPAPDAFASALWRAAAIAFFALLAAHALVPFPYADYNTPAMPLAALALGVPLGALAGRAAADSRAAAARIAFAALATCLAFTAASPWPMRWIGGRQDRFWFETRTESALSSLRRAARVLRDADAAGRPLFTQDAYLAVEAGLPVEPGLEMGPFSLFPALSDDEARARHVHNLSTLRRAIDSTRAVFAATSGYTFAIACPSTDPLPESDRAALLSALDARFPRLLHSDPRFGQQETPLEIRASPHTAPR